MSSLNHSIVRTHDFEPLTVEGLLPEGLAGTVYRAGPALLERFGQSAGHPFLADGAITAVRFKPDGAQGASRIVESAEYREEEAEGRLLYAPSAPRGRSLRNLVGGRKKATGNTNLLNWRGRLLALMEGAKPVELDPDTLESLGTTDLAVVRDAFSAHPHRVEALKTTFNFGMRGRSIDLYALPDGAPARWLGSFDLPWISMVHDFIATEKHLVFIIGPAKLVLWRAALAIGDVTQYLRWDPEAGALIVVVPLAEPQNAVKFTVDAFWVWHFANAFENGAHVVVDFCWHQTCGAFAAPSSTNAQHCVPQLRRLSIDPARKTLDEETLWAAPSEFPSVHPNKTGGRHRYVWLQSLPEPPQHPGVARFDCETGEVESWAAPTAHLGSEPMFVPCGEGEESGWVLQLFQDPAAERSYLAVLDAERPGDGPLAKVWFNQPVPMTFHGIFVQ